jgi:hypothetical protein
MYIQEGYMGRRKSYLVKCNISNVLILKINYTTEGDALEIVGGRGGGASNNAKFLYASGNFFFGGGIMGGGFAGARYFNIPILKSIEHVYRTVFGRGFNVAD